jgi:cardiolipin synthase (CMP-forming)
VKLLIPKHDGRVQHIEMPRVLNVPNLLSISRLFLLPVILLLLQQRQTIPALALMTVSWITDGLDGYLARRLNQVTTLGKILDHLVDKIWVGTVLVMLTATRGLPFFIPTLVIGRDLLIVIGSLLILDRRRHIVSSNIIGKATGCTFALLMVLYLVDDNWHWLRQPKLIMLWVVSGMVALSLVNYVVVYFRTMGRTPLTAGIPEAGTGSTQPRS